MTFNLLLVFAFYAVSVIAWYVFLKAYVYMRSKERLAYGGISVSYVAMTEDMVPLEPGGVGEDSRCTIEI